MSDDIICVIYARTACDTIQHAGITEQRRLCQAFAKRKGWKLRKKEYSDSGVSGNAAHKPALSQLLSDVKKGGIDKVVMTDVMRLQRGDMATSDDFIRECKQRGAEVVFVEHAGLEGGAAASNIIRTIKRAMMAQMEWIMPDITMCENDACPIRHQCYRFMAKPDAWQSVACFTPLSDTECEHFMALKHEKPWKE